MDKRIVWGLKRGLKRGGQSLVEFAMAAPILFLLMFGVFELGRVVFLFSTLNNASREAARYGAATGNVGGTARYLACDEIRQAAIDAAFLSGLEDGDIQIGYERPVGNELAGFAHCGDTGLSTGDIQIGDRIVVTITRPIEPILTILPAPQFSPSFVTARTILKDIVIGPVACSDGKDNDGDGDVDYPDDSGCSGSNDTTEAICYRLSVVGQPLQGGNLGTTPGSNCANRFIEQTFITVTADAAPAYKFENWSGDISTTENPTDFTINSDMDIIANFALLEADLRVTKDDNIDPVGVEEPYTYEILVTNLVTDDATSVVITDTLPSGVTFQGAFADSWSHTGAGTNANCTESGGRVVCTLDELSTGATATFSLDVNAPSYTEPVTKTITNTVTTSAFELDPVESNNTFTETTQIVPVANLVLQSVADTPDPVDAGDALQYTITLENQGPTDATEVTVVNSFSQDVSLDLTTPGCSQAPRPGPTIICTLSSLASGGTETITFSVTAPSEGGSLTNDVAVSANETDPDPSPSSNEGSATTSITAVADLEITKSDPDDPWTRDNPYSYQLTVENHGPSTATGIVVTDQLPDGVAVGVPAASADKGSCEFDSGVGPNGTVECTIGQMTADEPVVNIFINVTPISGDLTNTAQVTADTPEPSPEVYSNSNTESTTVNALVELTVEKSGPDNATVGVPFDYTVTVTNNGPSTANNVRVTDILPAGVSYLSQSGCDRDVDPEFSCIVGTLAKGEEATVTITVEPTTEGEISNSASAKADETGSSSYSSGTVTTSVGPAPYPAPEPAVSGSSGPFGLARRLVAALAAAVGPWLE